MDADKDREDKEAKERARGSGSSGQTVGAVHVPSSGHSKQQEQANKHPERKPELRLASAVAPESLNGSGELIPGAVSSTATSTASQRKAARGSMTSSSTVISNTSSSNDNVSLPGAVGSTTTTTTTTTTPDQNKLRIAPASVTSSSESTDPSASNREGATIQNKLRLGEIAVGVSDKDLETGAEEVGKKDANLGKQQSLLELQAIAVEEGEAERIADLENMVQQLQQNPTEGLVVAEAVDEDSLPHRDKKKIMMWCIAAVVIIVAVVLGVSSASGGGEATLVVDKNIGYSELSATPSEAPTGSPTECCVLDYSNHYFNRISTFPLCLQLDDNCTTGEDTSAEIVHASADGMMLAYSDMAQHSVGFVDISDPSSPIKAGLVKVGGEATSVVVKDGFVAVTVNTSPNTFNPSGSLTVIDIATQTVVAAIDLGGQPDSVAVSPDHQFLAVAIENQRDEDFNEGALPQAPAGFLQVIDCASEDPMEWNATKVDLTGLDGVLYNTDPEPEFVSINTNNIAVVTLQENNGIVLVNLTDASVMHSFSAGIATVENVDILEEDVIAPNGQISSLREPDGVTWIGTKYFATADEGDLQGGSRGFTIFDTEGNVVYTSGNTLDDLAIRFGHYPDTRSKNRGNEPENVSFAQFESLKLLFIDSERSGLVFVFEVSDITKPVFRQAIPTGNSPEGIFAIPSRNLVVSASEDRVSVYQMNETSSVYPHMVSTNDENGMPIPFSSLSGLSFKDGLLYSVEDSFYKQSRMFAIDPSSYPYTVTKEVKITDPNGVLAGALDVTASGEIMNPDNSVNLNSQGIEAVDGGFWIVSEGKGTFNDTDKPVETPNLLLFIDANGVTTRAVTLPEAVNNGQFRYGFEGVAVEGDIVVVAFQRAWDALGDIEPRLGLYNSTSDNWKFVFYPLDTPESQAGGWVGLSDVTSLGNGKFLMLESDNKGGIHAAVKRIYSIDLGDFSIADGETIAKTFVRDLIPDLLSTGGMVVEKVEGLTVDDYRNIWVNNDNEGVDGNSGEQLLLNVGPFDK